MTKDLEEIMDSYVKGFKWLFTNEVALELLGVISAVLLVCCAIASIPIVFELVRDKWQGR